ncbi:MAG: cytochrome b N-terminal domain-containing protein [Elusimicrobia bacterium]|nr:cytochrome b N-terminal domain-containing protein [Elusimicrobiota bacterium]
MADIVTPPVSPNGRKRLDFDQIKKTVIDSQIWRSIFRGGVWKDTPRDRAAHIIGNVWLHLHPVKVRKRAIEWTYTWGLGGISFMLFLILTLTGVLLMFYYRPTIDLAYRDMKDLEFAVTLGKLMRNAHRWSAQAMVVFVILHMMRVFLTAAYKKPREFNWGVGVLLLTFTLFLSFTGYLLPWDQLAIWAVTVGTNMAGASPFLGNEGPFGSLMGMRINNDIRFTLLGGTTVGENTLLRFYVLHCVAVPLLVGVLLILHFWRIRKDSFSAAPRDPNEEKVEVWPNLIVREYMAAAGCVLVILLWSVLQNAPLEVVANPNVTPNPSKAPWYFVGLQELLVYFDPWIAGVVIPTVIIIGLMAIPYLDEDPRGVGYYSIRERPFANTLFLLGIAMWFILIFIGYFCRGPNYQWYWPWESWLKVKAPPPPTWSLPMWAGGLLLLAYFGLGLVAPKLIQKDINWKKAFLWCGAALTGFSLICLFQGITWDRLPWLYFFGFAYFLFGFLVPQRYIRTLSWTRYIVTMSLVLMMMGVLLKMGLRLGFDIKYVFTLPQFSLNI